MPQKKKIIKRGAAVRVPGPGSITIRKTGEVVFKPAKKKPARKANPSRRKTKKQMKRGVRALGTPDVKRKMRDLLDAELGDDRPRKVGVAQASHALAAAMEFVLDGLHQSSRIAKEEAGHRTGYKDLVGTIFNRRGRPDDDD